MMAQVGQKLLEVGLISEAQLDAALERKRETGAPLGDVFVEMGLATARIVGMILEEAIGVPYVDLSEITIESDLLRKVSEKYQRRHRVIPYKLEGQRLYVAMSDPLNIMIIDDLSMMTSHKIVPMLSLNTEIQDAFSRAYTVKNAAESVLREIEDAQVQSSEPELSIDQLAELAEDAPIIRLVNSIIAGGVNGGASDVHIEPQEQHVRVRYRMDGLLYEQMTIPSHHHPALVRASRSWPT